MPFRVLVNLFDYSQGTLATAALGLFVSGYNFTRHTYDRFLPGIGLIYYGQNYLIYPSAFPPGSRIGVPQKII